MVRPCPGKSCVQACFESEGSLILLVHDLWGTSLIEIETNRASIWSRAVTGSISWDGRCVP